MDTTTKANEHPSGLTESFKNGEMKADKAEESGLEKGKENVREELTGNDRSNNEEPERKKAKTAECVKPHYRKNKEGLPAFLNSTFNLHYVASCDLSSKQFNKTFRRRFRVTFQQYRSILALVVANDKFKRWMTCDGDATFDKKWSPIEVLVLGAVRYLKGTCIDDLAESTAIDEETLRPFLDTFIQCYGRDCSKIGK